MTTGAVTTIPLLDRPHEEARRLLAGGAPVYLPINPVEYHGPHLPLHTDGLISQGLIEDLGARLAARHPDWPVLVAASMEIGVDPVPGPGSRPVPYRVARALVLQAVEALHVLGARRLLLMTFHGSPLHGIAMDAGVRRFEALGGQAFAPLNLLLNEMLDLEPARYAGAVAHIQDAAERQAVLDGLSFDYHGGFFETSMLLHYRPDAVAPTWTSVPPCPTPKPNRAALVAARIARGLGFAGLGKELAYAAHGLGWYALRPFPGYTGRPHHATPESGAFFARQIADRYAERAEAIFRGEARSPKPIMAWMSVLPGSAQPQATR